MGAKRIKRHIRPGVQELSLAQELELLCGSPDRSYFTSDAERRAAWFAHRERLMQGRGEIRPLAWHWYEARTCRPGEIIRVSKYVEGKPWQKRPTS